ncbi:MAG: hypothetical protein ACW99A_24170, partial [Candidatus Kariarchaeaceae archaeon]
GIYIQNSKPLVANITISGGQTTLDDITVSYDFFDIDGDVESPLTKITWMVLHLGSFIPNIPSQKTLANSWITAGDFVFCLIQPSDGEAFGILVDSSSYPNGYQLIGNTAPELSSIPIILNSNDNQNFTVTTALRVNFSAFDIDHGESNLLYDIEIVNNLVVGSEYRWYRNNQTMVDLQGPSINDYSYLNKGDTWIVSVRPRDRFGDFGSWMNSSAITIKNTPPSIIGFTWAQSNATTTDNLNFSYNYFDSDSDEEWTNRSFIRWYKNNVEIPQVENQTTFNHTYFSKNDSIHVVLSTFDGEVYSSNYMSNTLKIVNSRPIASNVSIEPKESFTDDSLTLNWNYYDSDDDNESLIPRIRWFKDGILQEYLNDSVLVSSVSLNKGEWWIATLQVFDGEEYSNIYTPESVTIQNSPK